MNGELCMRLLVTSNDLHMEVILACVLYLEHGRHPSLNKTVSLGPLQEQCRGLYPSGLAEANGAGLNCSGFKAFHRTTNAVLGCWPMCSDGIPSAIRSNHTCFWVIFIGPFTAFWLFPLPFHFGSFSQPTLVSGICQSPPDQQWISQHHKCLSHNRLSRNISVPHWGGLEMLGWTGAS